MIPIDTANDISNRVLTFSLLFFFKIRDYCGEVLEGGFYEEEIQLVKAPEYFKIEKILKTKYDRGRKKYLVKWMYYPDCASSWIDDSDMKK